MTAVEVTPVAWDSVLADEVRHWGVTDPAVALVSGSRVVGTAGPIDAPRRWASVTKVVAALAVLDVVDERLLDLDEPAGPEGSTVRHLLAHASGLALNEHRTLAAPGTRRIYSNLGIDLAVEVACQRVGAANAAALLSERVLAPLGMSGTTIEGPAAYGAVGPVSDLASLARELLSPVALKATVVQQAVTPAFPELAGVLPGYGRQAPNDWGLGIEVRGRKSPHWTPDSLPVDSFGHFGQSGSFLWVDRSRDLAFVAATDVDFGPWAAAAWPLTSARVIDRWLDSEVQ